jgi:WD40 repeat protein
MATNTGTTCLMLCLSLLCPGCTDKGDDRADFDGKVEPRLTISEVRTLRGHSSHIFSIAFSPDGRRALSAGSDSVRLWNLNSGEEVRKFTPPPGWNTRCVAFSPNGQFALIGSVKAFDPSGYLCLWDVTTGREVRRFAGETTFLHQVVFSPDGKRALSASGEFSKQGGCDPFIRLWDVETGKELRRFDHQFRIERIGFLVDGTRAVSVTLGGSAAHLWDLKTGRKLREFEIGPQGTSCLVDVSADGHRVLTNYLPAAQLWNVETGEQVRCFDESNLAGSDRPPPAEPGQDGDHYGAYAVALSADGKRALLCVDHLEQTTKAPSAEPGANGHRGERTHRSIKDFCLQLWDIETGRELGRSPKVPAMTYMVISPDGNLALTGEGNGTLRLWNLAD